MADLDRRRVLDEWATAPLLRSFTRPSGHWVRRKGAGDVKFGKTTPIVRILDEAKAREFYIEGRDQ
jgi:hypothetical protein